MQPPHLTIQNQIQYLRGKPILLDRDLARLYNVETKVLNQTVKRNRARFPDDFMFQLNKDEFEKLVTNCDRLKDLKHSSSLPFAFTELGVAMLSSVLRSELAIRINIQIIHAFVTMRHQLFSNELLITRIDTNEKQQQFTDDRVNQLFDAMENNKLPSEKGVFFEGEVFDAYLFVIDLIKSARKSIILIDNYVNENTLLVLSKRDNACCATIYTSKINQKLTLDLNKHNEQYPRIELKQLKSSHDRFLILDHERLYHFGASIKDLSKKWFAFSRIDEFLPHISTKLSTNEN